MSILDEIKESLDSERTLIYQNRINALKSSFGDISHLEKGVEDSIEKLKSNINLMLRRVC